MEETPLTPFYALAEDLSHLIETKYPGLQVEEVCAAMELIRIRLIAGAILKESELAQMGLSGRTRHD